MRADSFLGATLARGQPGGGCVGPPQHPGVPGDQGGWGRVRNALWVDGS